MLGIWYPAGEELFEKARVSPGPRMATGLVQVHLRRAWAWCLVYSVLSCVSRRRCQFPVDLQIASPMSSELTYLYYHTDVCSPSHLYPRIEARIAESFMLSYSTYVGMLCIHGSTCHIIQPEVSIKVVYRSSVRAMYLYPTTALIRCSHRSAFAPLQVHGPRGLKSVVFA